jgi:putative oxygen-independent coproporphyrinogen III oxidase
VTATRPAAPEPNTEALMSLLVIPPLSLYIHFPWCVRKCPYCDFNSYTLHGELAEDRYVDALEQDIQSQSLEVSGRDIISLFLGGGTPSLFSPEAIGRVIAAARKHLTVAADVEITMEANPGTIERGRFAEYRAVGINRVSLGAQTFDPRRLEILGRIHSPDETRHAAEELHSAGIENFNLDLMYALPGQDITAALRDVEAAIALAPMHLSHYQLTLEPGTVFAAKPPDLPSDDIAAGILTACTDRLAEAGFAQYEVSAYARPGRRCRHNLNYWNFGDYLGVGAGAHGKLTFLPGSVVRTTHAREPRRYLTSVPATATRASVPAEQLPFEFMLNALRLVEGFEVSTFSERTGIPWERMTAKVDALVKRQLLVVEGTRLRSSYLGLQFLNDVLLSFLAETPRTSGSFGLSIAV